MISPPKVVLRRLLPLVLISGIAACSDAPPPPPQVFPPLDYSYLPPIVLNVSNITVQNNYVPDEAASTLIGEDPEPPANALTAMLQRRLVAGGTPGNATITIENASIEQVGSNFVGLMTIRLDVASLDGRKTGFTEASVSVTQTVPDSDATQNQVQGVLYSVTRQLMDSMNVQLQYQIQRNMGSWISYNANAATPALNSGPITQGAIQATPLTTPGSIPGTTPGSIPGTIPNTTQVAPTPLTPASGAPIPLTPPPATSPPMPPMGTLGTLPVTPVPPVPSTQ